MLATLRTNAFRRLFANTDGSVDTVLSFKLDPRRIRGLPAPLPQLETWVFAQNVMGTHLRFGHIARGGIRWTDRVEDFRTQVLGLVRAQMMTNAVIVPTGSKGAFLPRLLHTGVDRAQQLEIGRAAYSTFVEGLLDLSDNFTKDESGTYRVDPAPHTVRHDGDDTNLVLAADKDTAQFSDVANAIATSREFWLGDAFASGGSNGYDHKQMGITARGVWESVRQHLFELGIDADTDPVTVVGIGDRAGTSSGTDCSGPGPCALSPPSITGTYSSIRSPRRARRSKNGSGSTICPARHGRTTAATSSASGAASSPVRRSASPSHRRPVPHWDWTRSGQTTRRTRWCARYCRRPSICCSTAGSAPMFGRVRKPIPRSATAQTMPSVSPGGRCVPV